jgi:predicted transposase YdaD
MKTFIDEYIEQGRKKGRKEGRQEGRQEGMQQAGYKILSTQLTHRFGDLPLSP